MAFVGKQVSMMHIVVLTTTKQEHRQQIFQTASRIVA